MIFRLPSQFPGKTRRGFALILVLTAIVLMAILVVSFLSSVTTDLQSSKVYANGTALKLLSQTASNLVIGQIRLATADASLDWASQPGMIRTYNTNGAADAYYKLYSDSQMHASGAFDHTQSSNGVPSAWYQQKGVYIDLNQPVAIDGTSYFPILDGNVNDVAGFSLSSTATPVDKTTSSANPAPMPVKWLYILQNGQIIAPDTGSTTGTVSFTGAPTQPSGTNQIVGRIAFWTDDDTCKVNINTASEGAFWDTPRTYTNQDYYLATRQPVQGEFQRYPGHPATVSLSAVLGGSSTAATGTWAPDNPISHEDLYPVTPATEPGGSKGGTIDTSPASTIISSSVSRLYATVDEFLFQPSLSASARQLNASLLTSSTAWNLSPDVLRKKSFFLTASSQAPDVNVFNLPRISMWPITLDSSSGNPAMTPYDKLIAFCTTINDHIFYFQRRYPNDPKKDLDDISRNRELLEYLQTLTSKSIPGFGTGSFSDKYGDDCSQILTEMFDYIRCTNLQDSTTGATPYTKAFDTTSSSASYLGGQGQVVPIVDTQKSVSDTTGGTSNPRGFGRFPTVCQAAMVFIGAGDINTSSKTSTGAPGFSGYSFAAITGSSVQRVQAGFFVQTFDPSQGLAVTYPWYEIEIDGLDSFQWSNDGSTYYSMQLPTSGTISKPYTRLGGILYGGINDFRLLTTSRGKPGSTNPFPQYPFITPPTGAVSGGQPSTCPDMNNGQIYFKGGNATVKIYSLDKNGDRGSLLQTVNLSFPSATIPVPSTIDDPSTALSISNPSNYSFQSFYDSDTAKGRLNFSNYVAWIGSHDVVRAVVATPGDMRLIAARSNVPASFYKPLSASLYPASDYYSSSVSMSHMLRYGLNYPIYGGAGGKLVNVSYQGYLDKYNNNDTNYYGGTGNSTYFRTKDTNVPTNAGVTTSNSVPADWDTGIANSHDGSFINKADEGDAGTQGANSTPYFELDYNNAQSGDTFFSPNRMIPSPGMFGSLSTGVWSNTPWQTLLFRPGPSGHVGLGVATTTGSVTMPPYTTPPDHLFMDLFNMPVVEPYAISTPLATAGRINMNYLIVPFTYINRDTGLRAAMKAQMITVIPSPAANGNNAYKTRNNPNGSPGTGNAPSTSTVRYPIDLDATLSQFQARFDAGDIFRAASEICTIDLVPSGVSDVPSTINRSSMDTFWKQYPLTGDNVRERPYTNLYPLLTTKSNTYTIHMRVQSLKQVTRKDSTSYKTWRETSDVVTGEYRGLQTIERYIDPNDTLPDYATDSSTATPLSQFYKFRTLLTRQFAP